MQIYTPTPAFKIDEKLLFDYNPLVLSLIGDGVHTLFIRSMLVERYPYSSGGLHNKASDMICACSQAKIMENLKNILVEDEIFIYKKCKNSKCANIPKHASIMEYKMATAFEGIIGYLYLNGKIDRLTELLNFAYGGNNAIKE